MLAGKQHLRGNRRLFSIAVLFLLQALAFSPTCAESSRSEYAIRNVSVIDVVSGRVLPRQTVLVSGNRIANVGRIVSIPAGAHVIDGSGKFLAPGFWDMHVHTVHRSYLDLFVANGITGIRDMGGNAVDANTGCESISPSILVSWRRQILDGHKVGPRMLISGPAVSNTGWPTSIKVSTPDEARDAVRTLKRLGVDFVKVYEKIPIESYRTLLREAKMNGLTVAGHIPMDTVSLLEASDAGQRSIEHIRDPLLMCFTRERDEIFRFFKEDNWSPADLEWGLRQFKQCPRLIEAFRKNRTWLVPTLSVERSKAALEDPLFVTDPRRDSLPSSVRAGFDQYVARKNGQTEVERSSDKRWWRNQQTLVSRMHREGVGSSPAPIQHVRADCRVLVCTTSWHSSRLPVSNPLKP